MTSICIAIGRENATPKTNHINRDDLIYVVLISCLSLYLQTHALLPLKKMYLTSFVIKNTKIKAAGKS